MKESLERLPPLQLLGIVFFVAILVRLSAMVFLQHGCFMQNRLCEPEGDQPEYLGLAQNIADGKGYTFDYGFSHKGEAYTYRVPGYPAFLAGALKYVPGNYFLIRLLQVLLSISVVFYIYRLAQVFLKPSWALYCALFCAASPFFFYFSLFFVADFLYQLLFICGLVVVFLLVENKRPLFSGVAGGLLGGAALCRGEAYYLNYVVLVFLAYMLWRKKVNWQSFLTYILIFAILVGAWMYRNYAQVGRFIGLQPKIAGLTMVFGFMSVNTGIAWPEYDRWAEKAIEEYEIREKTADSGDWLLSECEAFFKAHPVQFSKVLALKFLVIWKMVPQQSHSWGKTPYQESMYKWLSLLTYAWLIPFAIWGLYLLCRSRPEYGVFIIALVFSITLVAALSSNAMRHRIVAMPFFYICAFLGLGDGLERLGVKCRRK